MPKKQILIIEDERDIAEMVVLRLKKENFEPITANSGEQGLALAKEYQPDLVLLDLMLPITNGLEVLKSIRKDRLIRKMPVIIVSAKGEESDIIVGLELGADDYITKPFNMSVLVARINAVLRRFEIEPNAMPDVLRFGSLEIDAERFCVFLDNEQISLTPTEFRLLYALAASQGRVLTRNQLIERAIGNDTFVTDRTIDVHLASLRNKLKDARDVIDTVRGIGYRFVEKSEGKK